MTDVRRYQLIALLAAVLALTVAFVRPQETNAPTNTNTVNTNTVANTNTVINGNVNAAVLDTLEFTVADLPDASSKLRFRLRLMTGWAAEVVDEGATIRFIDPSNDGVEQLRVTTYESETFSAPTDVIGTATIMTIDGQVAQRYAIPDSQDATQTSLVYDTQSSNDQTLVTRFTFASNISLTTATEIMSTVILSR